MQYETYENRKSVKSFDNHFHFENEKDNVQCNCQQKNSGEQGCDLKNSRNLKWHELVFLYPVTATYINYLQKSLTAYIMNACNSFLMSFWLAG